MEIHKQTPYSWYIVVYGVLVDLFEFLSTSGVRKLEMNLTILVPDGW